MYTVCVVVPSFINPPFVKLKHKKILFSVEKKPCAKKFISLPYNREKNVSFSSLHSPYIKGNILHHLVLNTVNDFGYTGRK